MNPKVFLCHASEDKNRFVLKFAEKLYKYGIEVWVDIWEMKPGDKLIEKIFDQGIKNSQSFIIVLSNYSINKPWVREELDVAMVNRIEGKTKLIPVLIDECEVPECLKSTKWIRIKNIESYDNEFKEITSSILGRYEKPKLGTISKHVKTIIDIVPTLSKIDNLIFYLACKEVVECKNNLIVTTS